MLGAPGWSSTGPRQGTAGGVKEPSRSASLPVFTRVRLSGEAVRSQEEHTPAQEIWWPRAGEPGTHTTCQPPVDIFIQFWLAASASPPARKPLVPALTL